MKGLPLAVVALASATRVAAQYTPNLIFNMTLSTMTGIWDWSLIENEAARDEAAGIIPWRSWYTGMEDIPQLIYGMIGEGVPWHYITAQYYSPDLLPSFIFSFPGTAWSLTGGWRPWNATSSDNDVEVRVDGSFSTLESPNINLGGQHGLSWSYHTVNYTIRSDYVGGGNMTVYNLTVTTGMVSDALSLDQVPRETQYFVVDGGINPNFTTYNKDGWTISNEFGGWGGQQPIAYTQLIGNNSVNANDLTMISVPIPRGTAFVTLNGTMGPDYWYNGVTWDPVPTLGKNPTTINCYTGWDVPNTLLMFQPLDPTVEYLMTVGVPYNPTKMGLGLTSVTFYAGSFNDVNSTTNVGAIVGGVVGGVVGLAAIAAAIFFCMRRKKKSAHPADTSRFEVDESTQAATPFLTPPPGQQMSSVVPTAAAVQTYNVQANSGGYTIGNFTAAPVNNDISPVPLSSPAFSSPELYSTHSGSNLIPVAVNSAYENEETSSVSPSMSASVSAAGEKRPSIVPFGPYASGSTTSQTGTGSATASSEKREARSLPQPSPGPPVQEVDGGDDANAHLMESGSQMAGIPPVYNPEWADRRASGPTANTPPGAQAPSVHPTDATGRASGLPSVDSTNTAGWQTPREF